MQGLGMQLDSGRAESRWLVFGGGKGRKIEALTVREGMQRGRP